MPRNVPPGLLAAVEGQAVHLNSTLDGFMPIIRSLIEEPDATDATVFARMSAMLRGEANQHPDFTLQLLVIAMIRLAKARGSDGTHHV